MEDKLKKLGIDCPECKSFICTPLEQILFGNQFECHSCLLKFSLDKRSSKQVLQQLQAMNFSF